MLKNNTHVIAFLIILFAANIVFAYTEQEYRIYHEMMDMPMTIPEEEGHKKLGKKYNMAPKEIKIIVRSVMNEIFAGGSSKFRKRERAIKSKIKNIVQVKSVLVSGEFANVGYIEKFSAWNDKDVRKKVLSQMPKILEEIFSVAGVERIRLTAYYPAQGGGEMKVAGLEANRSDFSPKKQPEQYNKFWVR